MSENPPENTGAGDDAAVESDKDSKTGHALYDVTLQRFIGPVRKTKAEAGKDKASAAKGHELEVRAV